jgi:outer membrane protein OmpA-like peptidoglycan-associated protein
MSAISYGEEGAAASNKTRMGRAQNRRVVLVVMS